MGKEDDCSNVDDVKTGYSEATYGHEDLLGVDHRPDESEALFADRPRFSNRLRGPARAGLAGCAWGQQDQHELVPPQPIQDQPNASTAETTLTHNAEARPVTDAAENLLAACRVVEWKPCRACTESPPCRSAPARRLVAALIVSLRPSWCDSEGVPDDPIQFGQFLLPVDVEDESVDVLCV